MRRKFIYRNEIVPVDTFKDTIGFITYGFAFVGSREYTPITLKVVSKRTGNVSRYLKAEPLEVEGLAGLYWMIHSSRQVKAKERVYIGDREADINPIGRVKYSGELIYSIQ